MTDLKSQAFCLILIILAASIFQGCSTGAGHPDPSSSLSAKTTHPPPPAIKGFYLGMNIHEAEKIAEKLYDFNFKVKQNKENNNLEIRPPMIFPSCRVIANSKGEVNYFYLHEIRTLFKAKGLEHSTLASEIAKHYSIPDFTYKFSKRFNSYVYEYENTQQGYKFIIAPNSLALFKIKKPGTLDFD